MTSTQIRRAVPDDLDMLLRSGLQYCVADEHAYDAALARAGPGSLLDSDERGTVWTINGGDGHAVVAWGWSTEIGASGWMSKELS